MAERRPSAGFGRSKRLSMLPLALRRMTEIARVTLVGLTVAAGAMILATYVELSRAEMQSRLMAQGIAESDATRGAVRVQPGVSHWWGEILPE
jgi:hypothetical protein